MTVAGVDFVRPPAHVGWHSRVRISPSPTAPSAPQRDHVSDSIRTSLAVSSTFGRTPITPVMPTTPISPASSSRATSSDGESSRGIGISGGWRGTASLGP